MTNTIEKITRAICGAYDDICTGCPSNYPEGCRCAQKAARAALAAVLEDMREPSGEMLHFGMAKTFQHRDGSWPTDKSPEAYIWQAMLDQYSKESLGE